MTALVIFESMFGNNRALAEAIAQGIAPQRSATVVEVGSAPTSIDAAVTLLVVGGPTHGFGMTRPSTRRDAAKQATGPLVSTGIGVREWLQAASVPAGIAAAAWDTRVERPAFLKLIDRSAEGMAKGLKRLGCRLVLPPQHFAVQGVQGPLGPNELERARRWGEQLAQAALGN